jgi:hypothetical protein
MAQQLQTFTRKMMERTVQAHSERTEHDKHCCQLAHEYAARLGMETTPSPQEAPRAAQTVPAPRATTEVTTTLVRAMSPAQARYIRNLRRKISLDLLSPEHRIWAKTVCDGDEITLKQAQELLEVMVSLSDQTPSARSKPEPAYIPEEGAYQVGDDVYLVVTSKDSGRRYAKQYLTGGDKFVYAGQSPFDMLTYDRLMTAEQAKQFADTYKRCCRCTRRLTKARSKDLGYGPTCAELMNWPY